MGTGGTGYHEDVNVLSEEAKNIHRALVSLIEELEAVDWYNQRVDVTNDEELKSVLAHNRDEEVEHAAMTLEWLRRMMPKFDDELKTYLFTEGPISAQEEEATSGDAGGKEGSSHLGIGKVKKGE